MAFNADIVNPLISYTFAVSNCQCDKQQIKIGHSHVVKRQGEGMGLQDFVVLWVLGYPQDFLWAWDGYGDRNSVPTAALQSGHRAT